MSIRRHVSLLLVAVTVALVGNVSVAGFASAWSQEVGGDYAGMTEAAGSGQPAINRTPTRPLALKLAAAGGRGRRRRHGGASGASRMAAAG